MLKPLWMEVWQFLINPALPYNPAIVLLVVYSDELNTCLHKTLNTKFYSGFILSPKTGNNQDVL